MTTEQIKTRAMELVMAHPPVEVGVRTLDDQLIVGVVSFAGENKFRLDTPQAVMFFEYGEVEAIG